MRPNSWSIGYNEVTRFPASASTCSSRSPTTSTSSIPAKTA